MHGNEDNIKGIISDKKQRRYGRNPAVYLIAVFKELTHVLGIDIRRGIGRIGRSPGIDLVSHAELKQ